MAPRSRRPDAAELGHRIWDHLRGRAENLPGEFTPDTRDDVTGWLWEGAVASLIREAIPGITDSDLRRAREYLNASGMVVNVRGHQRGAGPPQWFIRSSWHQGPGGHVHVVATHRPGQPAAPAASQPAAGNERKELAGQSRQDIANTLESLIQQVSDLQSDNDRLRGDNDRLHAEIKRIRALARDAGQEIARRASQLLADAENQRPPTSQPLELHFRAGALFRVALGARHGARVPGSAALARARGQAGLVPWDAHQALPMTVTSDCGSAAACHRVWRPWPGGQFQERIPSPTTCSGRRCGPAAVLRSGARLARCRAFPRCSDP